MAKSNFDFMALDTKFNELHMAGFPEEIESGDDGAVAAYKLGKGAGAWRELYAKFLELKAATTSDPE